MREPRSTHVAIFTALIILMDCTDANSLQMIDHNSLPSLRPPIIWA
jgi:hypothetical protein